MITAWDIYWITRLDSITGVLVFLIGVSSSDSTPKGGGFTTEQSNT